jgi:hypothetical protein
MRLSDVVQLGVKPATPLVSTSCRPACVPPQSGPFFSFAAIGAGLLELGGGFHSFDLGFNKFEADFG